MPELCGLMNIPLQPAQGVPELGTPAWPIVLLSMFAVMSAPVEVASEITPAPVLEPATNVFPCNVVVTLLEVVPCTAMPFVFVMVEFITLKARFALVLLFPLKTLPNVFENVQPSPGPVPPTETFVVVPAPYISTRSP